MDRGESSGGTSQGGMCTRGGSRNWEKGVTPKNIDFTTEKVVQLQKSGKDGLCAQEVRTALLLDTTFSSIIIFGWCLSLWRAGPAPSSLIKKEEDFLRMSRCWNRPPHPPRSVQNPVHTPTRFMAGMAGIHSRDDSKILEKGVGFNSPAVILPKGWYLTPKIHVKKSLQN